MRRRKGDRNCSFGISGRKITPKMKNAINNIIIRNSPEEMTKRDEWVEKVVPKIIMVREMISDTSWTTGYRGDTHNFINSIIEQAKSRKTLSKKQMEAVNKVYLKCKKILIKIKKRENSYVREIKRNVKIIRINGRFIR